MRIKNFIKKISNSTDIELYPDPVIIINSFNDIIGWNSKAEDIFGYLESEIIGKNVALLFDNDVNKIHLSVYEKTNLIITAKNKNGQDVITDISCARINNDKDIIISLRDVTKNQKIIEKLLIEYEKAVKTAHYRSGFLASFSNELKNPVHSVIGFSQGMLDGICGILNEKQEKYVSIINKNANNLLALINNIVSLSMMEIGQIQPEYKVFDVTELVESVKNDLENTISEKNIIFTLDFSENGRKNIYSDENMLRQILLNLFTNAIKFTDAGSIRVKLSCPDFETIEASGIKINPNYTDKSYLMVMVFDTGIGISEEDKPKIFDEYKKPGGTMAKKYGGTGLGLSVTRNLTGILGGKIWFESSLGEGSVFGFIIPAERIIKPGMSHETL